MIYRDAKLSKTRPEEWRGGMKPRQPIKSEKENKDKSKSGTKNDIAAFIKKHADPEKLKFNMTA